VVVRDGVIVVVMLVVILLVAIMIVVVIIVVGPSPLMLVRPEVEVIVIDDLTAHYVLVAEEDVLQRRRGQPGQGEQNPHRPKEDGGAGTDGPVEARRLSRWSCA
jgi:hypothetical protein